MTFLFLLSSSGLTRGSEATTEGILGSSPRMTSIIFCLSQPSLSSEALAQEDEGFPYLQIPAYQGNDMAKAGIPPSLITNEKNAQRPFIVCELTLDLCQSLKDSLAVTHRMRKHRSREAGAPFD